MAQSHQITFNSNGWGAVFLDADNDMDLDLYVSGESNGSLPQYLSSAFYENVDTSYFQLNNNAVPNDFAYSFGNALGDTDNDGYPEIVVNNIDHDNIYLWKNNTNTSNNWLKVKLEGTTSNRNGVGSFIEISINGNKQYRYSCLGEGYLSQNSATEHFGLGIETIVDYIKVKWLSGIEDIIYNVSANQTLNIVEGSSLSLNDYENLEGLTFYPNPVDDILTLDAKKEIESVRVYNLLGQLVMSSHPKAIHCEVDLTNMQKGTYIVKIEFIDALSSIRIIKQ
jgi:hypothetical protein